MTRLSTSLLLTVLALLAALGLAACDPVAIGPVPVGPETPVVSSAEPGSTQAVGPSPSGIPESSPSPTSGTAVAVAVLDGLRAFAADPKQTYRVTLTGTARGSADTLKVKGTLDVAGADAAFSASFRFPGGRSTRTDYRRVGDNDWVRFRSKGWAGLSGVKPAAVIDPFAGTHDGTHLQYLGQVKTEAGHYLVQLTGIYLHPTLIPAVNLTAEKVTRTKLLLVTDANGVPVRATWSLEGQGRVSGQLQAIVVDLKLTWSRIGRALTIKAP